MFSTIWEFLFCPQHGIIIQGWAYFCVVTPVLVMAGWSKINRAVLWCRKKVGK